MKDCTSDPRYSGTQLWQLSAIDNTAAIKKQMPDTRYITNTAPIRSAQSRFVNAPLNATAPTVKASTPTSLNATIHTSMRRSSEPRVLRGVTRSMYWQSYMRGSFLRWLLGRSGDGRVYHLAVSLTVAMAMISQKQAAIQKQAARKLDDQPVLASYMPLSVCEVRNEQTDAGIQQRVRCRC